MNTQQLLALKNGIRELVRKRPGYRSIGVMHDARLGDQVLIDVEPDADLTLYKDVTGKHDDVNVTVRRVSGRVRAERLRAGQ